MCTTHYGVVQFNVELKDEGSEIVNYLPNLNAKILDTPYNLIIGRPDIIKYDLLHVLTSHFSDHREGEGELPERDNLDSAHTVRSEKFQRTVVHPINPELNLLLSKSEFLDPIVDDYGSDDEKEYDLPWETTSQETPSALDSAPKPRPLIEGPAALQYLLNLLVDEYEDIFSETLRPRPALLTPMTLEVDKTKWQQNRNRLPPRTQTRVKEKEIERQITNMLAAKVITPSQAAYYSQVQLTPKPNDKWRFCIDYRSLNECSNLMGWPIPNVSAMLQRLGNQRARFYAVMDLTSGYHQAPLSKGSQAASAFITFMGVYEWLRVPMGLKGAPSHFQQRMATQVLKGLLYNCCEVYLDDIIVYGRTEEEFVYNLKAVFHAFRTYDLTLNPTKCRLGMVEVEYVGHIINHDGLSFSTKKREEVLNFPFPKTHKNMKQFLGLVNYFRDHVKNHSTEVQPLQDMVGKYDKMKILKWTPELEAVFIKVRGLVSSCPSLTFITDNLPIYLHTDASDYGIGAYLFQKDEVQRKENPIAFMSKSLTKERLGWSVPEKECYAIIAALKKFEYILRDSYFILKTDHKNLTYINSEGSAKVRRWKLAIQEHNFDIEYIPGDDNIVADGFSRLCEREEPTGDTLAVRNEELDYLPNSRYNQIKKVHNSLAGHNGVEKTLRKLELMGIPPWTNARKHIKEFIDKCPICQKLSERAIKVNAEPFTTAVHEPMHTLNMDSIGPVPTDKYGNIHILVIICCFTRFVELYAIPDVTGAVAARCLVQHIGRYGTPVRIRSDRGPQFVNETVQEVMKIIGTDHALTLAYSKEENGLVERANKEVMRHLRAILMDTEIVDEWSESLPLVQRIMNASVHSAIGYSPAQLLFGNAVTLDRGIFRPANPEGYKGGNGQPKKLSEWAEKMFVKQAQILEIARQSQMNTDDYHILEAEPGARTEYPINSYVLLKYRDRPPTKFHTKWAGPMRVVSNKTNTYTLQDLVTNNLRNYHVTQLKPFEYDPMKIDPLDVARKERDEYVVEKILGHKGAGTKRKNITFQVKWLGYDDSYNTWEPWESVRSNQELLKYCYNEHKPFRKFLTTEQKQQVVTNDFTT